ncbi:hypothetical protein ACFSKI_03465 [Pseudogracilibacillus auburnensis]|uniref:Uncharacterized protein n=1 Tax=Pseudogracilibacillus auburnensis TaxID=1494959 RepID=A0A2V3W2S3_9BACI|nr:hypothetical protein [Pseudogracilibacillus auburnensis]PXW88036.1 hypothetical protein DFR56_104187 [Pseudogracilibacillus auburnensis]
MKRFLYYFGWTIVIGIIIYFRAKYQLRLQQEASVTFEIVPVVLLSTIFPFAIGMLLRLPKLLNEIKQNKQWTFDWIKFIAIGLPSLCILLIYVSLFYLPESILLLMPQAIFLGNPTIHTIAGVVFGYTLLDSLKK